jgi:hypothetical protein
MVQATRVALEVAGVMFASYFWWRCCFILRDFFTGILDFCNNTTLARIGGI